jgi:anionic cell wall polymer biosynthesis LytR-Cps2A-Psr (LCP) family protein
VGVRGSTIGTLIFGKVGYIGACLAAAIVLVVGGYAHGLTSSLDGLEGGANLGGNVPPAAAQNILVMGLESRTNFEGQPLTSAQFTETHSGSVNGDQGAQDTDTLILIHINAGGRSAVGYSIPRDDVVNYPYELGGLTEGKIDGAYDVAYNTYITDNIGTMGQTAALYNGANQAGQLFETQTVESVTGVHIDNFVVSNIIGFYSIAAQLGGINVCIAAAPASAEPGGLGFVTGSNLEDLPYHGAPLSASNSGFDAFKDGYKEGGPVAQYLHLQPAQALAFVRARDSVPGIDIGRTARQQAAIDYIIYDFKNRNILSDPGTISGLLNSASSFLQVNKGFNLLNFAPQMQSLTGKNLKLNTLAEATATGIDIPGLGASQDGNLIYVPNLQQTVNSTFYGSQAVKASKSVTVDVYNSSGASGLAGEVSQAFAADGYSTGQAADSTTQTQQPKDGTQVFYGAGAAANAGSIAAMVGESSGATALSSLPAGHVEVLLGTQVMVPPVGLEEFGASTVTEQQFLTAAAENNLPASEQPPATATGSTQSVSATEIGPTTADAQTTQATAAQAQASQTAAAQSTLDELTALMQAAAPAQSAAAATATGPATSSTYKGPRPANAPAGIPCVY